MASKNPAARIGTAPTPKYNDFTERTLNKKKYTEAQIELLKTFASTEPKQYKDSHGLLAIFNFFLEYLIENCLFYH